MKEGSKRKTDDRGENEGNAVEKRRNENKDSEIKEEEEVIQMQQYEKGKR